MTDTSAAVAAAPLPTRELWAGGPHVGAVGLGCMGMTHGYDPSARNDDESVATVRLAVELGVTLIDTSDVYGPFTNEVLVGRAIAPVRDQVVLATKVGLVLEPGEPMTRNGRPDHIRSGCDASLTRLGVDHIDLYQLHRVDPDVPIEESWGAMAELVVSGKVGAIGLSEVSVGELDRAHVVHPVATVQSELSLWTRDSLPEVLPWCAAHGTGFLPFAPLGRGFLTGALTSGFEVGDFRAGLPRFTEEAMAANQQIVDGVRAVADRRAATPAQVALAWVLGQGDRVVPIPGTRRRSRVAQNAAAALVDLSAIDLA
ncbi:MAG TPA: aldo/keto reductase, partial [Candidatus Limnocylindria bacterium]|nr:aldo/keto reductase [Candidatus Limnocylindria bacterium]